MQNLSNRSHHLSPSTLATPIKTHLKTDCPDLKRLTDDELTSRLTAATARERRATIETIEHIREFMIRRLYLEHGCTSLFAYLTAHLHFSEATAQNRIDAARMLNQTPELAEKISSGAITLTQVSVVAQAMRQKRRGQKAEGGNLSSEGAESQIDSLLSAEATTSTMSLFAAIEGLDSKKSAVLVARELKIKPVTFEKTRPQQDESIRLEITLSKEEWAALRQARDLMSHRNPNASMSDVIAEVTRYFVRHEDPRLAKPKRRSMANKLSTRATEVTSDPKFKQFKRVAIPAATRRLIFARDKKCRWIHSTTGETCGSTFLLQIDHRVSVCAGGSNEPENLQLLCATHNRWKFEHA